MREAGGLQGDRTSISARATRFTGCSSATLSAPAFGLGRRVAVLSVVWLSDVLPVRSETTRCDTTRGESLSAADLHLALTEGSLFTTDFLDGLQDAEGMRSIVRPPNGRHFGLTTLADGSTFKCKWALGRAGWWRCNR